MHRCVSRQWWQHAKQDREERDGEADRDGGRGPRFSLMRHGPQRPEQGRAQHEGEAEPQPRVGKVLAVTPRCATRLEEAHLPQQRTRDGELDRDD